MGDCMQTTSDDSKGLFAVLELSFNDLPYYLKPCFMYLGHFPEDYEMSVDKIYHLWEAEGLVTKSEDDVGNVCLDDIAETYLNNLVERCLVQVGKRWLTGRTRTCRLHDVMRLMCLKKCKEVNFVKTMSTKETSSRKEIASSSSISMKLHRCALHLDDTKDKSFTFESSANIAPCIRSLLVFQLYWGNRLSFTSHVIKTLSLLRVLDLEGASIPADAKAIKDLIHLRYLSFNRARACIGFLPHFWDCKYLETLDLRCDAKTVMVKNKLWRLERLRHLYLPASMGLVGSKAVITLTENQLVQLETLKNYYSSFFGMESLWKMTSLRVFTFIHYDWLTRKNTEQFLKLPMIAAKRREYPLPLRLKAELINGDASVSTRLFSHGCIAELYIDGRIEDVSMLDRFDMRYVTQLDLCNTEIGQQGISVIEKLPLLTRLFLDYYSYVDKKMCFSSGGFPQLNELIMREIALEEWVIYEGAVPNLEHLVIKNCRGLKMIPSDLPRTVRFEWE